MLGKDYLKIHLVYLCPVFQILKNIFILSLLWFKLQNLYLKRDSVILGRQHYTVNTFFYFLNHLHENIIVR